MRRDEENRPRVKPEVMWLRDLLQLVEEGKIRVPDFQRPFVWSDDQMVSLFDTVLRGYPIGSILVWEPSDKDINLTSKSPEPFLIAPSHIKLGYVIDGYQRLTTLFSVLKNDELKSDPQHWKFSIYVDVEKEELTLEHHRGNRPIPPNLVPLHSLWRTSDLLDISARFYTATNNSPNGILRKLQGIYNDLQAFRIPVILMDGGDMDDAIEIFSRLNSTGRKVTEVQMLNALTKTDLSDIFADIRNALQQWAFDGIADRYLMRALYISSGMDMYKASPRDFARKAVSEQQEVAGNTKAGLALAARFLWEECHVPGIRWLPYALQFILLGEFFRACPRPTKAQIKVLMQWFWATSYQGWFAGANSTKINVALVDMLQLAGLNHEEESGRFHFEFRALDLSLTVEPFPAVYKANSARVKVFFLFYLSLDPVLFPDRGAGHAQRLLAEAGKEALVPMISTEKKDRISNLMIGHKISPGLVQSYLLNETDPNLLASHAVDAVGKTMLDQFDHRGFIMAREKYLMELETEFIRSKGLVPNKAKPSEPIEDSEIE